TILYKEQDTCFNKLLFDKDGAKITRQIEHLRKAFDSKSVRIKYDAKALTNISILKLIRTAGAEIEVVSLQEAALAMKAGFTPAEVTFTPSGVHFSEIEQAVSSGYSVNIDNLSTLKKFGEDRKSTRLNS